MKRQIAAAYVLACYASLAHGADLYVADEASQKIFRLDDQAKQTWFTDTGQSTSPAGLAFDAAGNLYVANYSNNTIGKFDSRGGVSTVSIFAKTGLNGPGALAFDTNGNLYVSNRDGNTIMRYNPAGKGAVFATTGLNGPHGLAFDAQGILYVANFFGGSIGKLDSLGNYSPFALLDHPTGLAFDASGRLYAASYSANKVVRFDSQGQPSDFATAGLHWPSSLAFDLGGNLFVANYQDGTIARFDLQGEYSRFATIGSYAVASGLAFRPTIASPTLRILASGSKIVVSWPSSANGFILQQKPTLASTIWTSVGAAPIITNLQHQVTLPTTGQSSFYRLKTP